MKTISRRKIDELVQIDGRIFMFAPLHGLWLMSLVSFFIHSWRASQMSFLEAGAMESAQ